MFKTLFAIGKAIFSEVANEIKDFKDEEGYHTQVDYIQLYNKGDKKPNITFVAEYLPIPYDKKAPFSGWVDFEKDNNIIYKPQWEKWHSIATKRELTKKEERKFFRFLCWYDQNYKNMAIYEYLVHAFLSHEAYRKYFKKQRLKNPNYVVELRKEKTAFYPRGFDEMGYIYDCMDDGVEIGDIDRTKYTNIINKVNDLFKARL